MKNRRTQMLGLATLLTVMVAGCATAPGEATEGEIAEIEGIFESYSRYAEVGDTAAWLALWDEDGIQMPPGAPERRISQLAEVLPTMWSNRVKSMDMVMEIEPLETVVSGDIAYIRCVYSQELTNRSSGAKTEIDGKALTVFRRQADGSWKIYRDCFNSNVSPES